MLALRDNVLGALVSHICGKFGAIGGAVCLDLGNILGAEARTRVRGNSFRSFSFLGGLGFLFRIFLFENGATNDRISICFRCGFLVFGFREVGGQCGDLVVVQVRAIAHRLAFL